MPGLVPRLFCISSINIGVAEIAFKSDKTICKQRADSTLDSSTKFNTENTEAGMPYDSLLSALPVAQFYVCHPGGKKVAQLARSHNISCDRKGQYHLVKGYYVQKISAKLIAAVEVKALILEDL